MESELKYFASLVNEEIEKMISSKEFPNLYDGMVYAFQTGGKRIRPFLCLITCKVLGGDIRKALPFAVSLELIHNSTLIHDDIEDEDEIRRNFPTVWKKYGVAHGINIGDGLIFKAYENLFKSKKYLTSEEVLKLSEVLTNVVMRIIEGQNMEFNFRKRNVITIEECMGMIWRKAGILFGTALWGGAFIANASEKVCEILLDYGKKIGSAFQIRDDILNLTGKKEKYGKEIGGDIKEGKRTLIIIHCLSSCNKTEREKMLKILKKSRSRTTDKDVEFAMKLIKKYNSINFAQKYSEKLVKEAKESVREIQNLKLKNVLEELADYFIKREY